ncbi:IS66-like element accessory protein TnpA [Burkholderia multivorans]|uniref:IS66-like element accessory protein TnpA n=1 Tax=Burkholderia multivorans TaxID=87883 RepID=UPI00130ECB33|nr:transposase [Burkholderia multivorans]
MNTIESEPLPERRRRQRYSEEFKAQVVATCQGIGVSVAAVALEHRLNANLLRRWIDQAEGRLPKRALGRPPAAPPSLPAFVPVAVGAPSPHSAEIRIEVRRGDQSITVSWPVSEAAQCAVWLREWLR